MDCHCGLTEPLAAPISLRRAILRLFADDHQPRDTGALGLLISWLTPTTTTPCWPRPTRWDLTSRKLSFGIPWLELALAGPNLPDWIANQRPNPDATLWLVLGLAILVDR
jgi:hypothetical protein